ncbi:M55 family metallopeptidase [Lederbergia sp. NSJ-179]|uniref:M55 family metallopeptidase n=1 Tax=Lederbergia sp. NSJ-179 TaxID=2931402 RepID=UPI001FD31A16|nr:M55 family metallopeptidase [Lederbergia sp. NSJ-179]MCJ7841219.1 M55 family metallopeptidase [Lederbergia sp. NSJ-179]
MNVYVSVDMEGIGGIVVREQCNRGTTEYAEARHLLTQEVNKLIEGLLEAGAKNIIVRDAHGTGFNFILNDLHPAACYVMGAPNKPNRFPKLNKEIDIGILMGYHAMASTAAAVRDHTMTSKTWGKVWLNGREVGEIWIDALLFSFYDVPIVMVTGDDKACSEARLFLPNVTTYETKEGFGHHAALLKPPEVVRQEIRTAACHVLRKTPAVQLVKEKTKGLHELIIEYVNTESVDGIYADGDRVIRLDGHRVLYRDNDLHELFRRVF